MRGILVGYEVHVALMKAVDLHHYKKDHVAHLAPATTAGIGALLGLPVEVIYQARVKEIVLHTSRHTHTVIGTGANDPQKFDPDASRETLDHSIMYILAVALEDGSWHHEASYVPERAHRPETIALWRKIKTVEDPKWEQDYHQPDPSMRAFGGRLEIVMDDGKVVTAEKSVADAHPNGIAPWHWPDYLDKFDQLSAGLISPQEKDRFLTLVEKLDAADADELLGLNPAVSGVVERGGDRSGIFDWE